MKPILFEIGNLKIYSYGVMIALAFAVSYVLITRRARKAGLKDELISSLMFWILISGILGARIFYVVQRGDYYWENIGQIAWIPQGGLVWYGGFFGALLGMTVLLRKKRISFWRVSDVMAPVLPLAQAIGRLGCFMNGCCYGRILDGESGFWFFSNTHDQGVQFPSQILSSALLLSLSFCLFLLSNQLKTRGVMSGVYLIGYGIVRFNVEFFRGDQEQFRLLLTLPQWISMGVIFCGVILIVWMISRRRGLNG